jgi:acetyl-CoA carboxylase carboxyltransferase component
VSTSEGDWSAELEELRTRIELAEQLGGAEAVARQRDAGRLTVRDRIERLADPGSFREVGRLAGRAVRAEDGSTASVTPANFLCGSLLVDGRPAVVTGYDYTVRGGAIEGGLGGKRPHAERMAHDLKVPLIRLVEGVGASVRGVRRMAATTPPTIPGWEHSVANLSRVPVVAAALGSLAGLPAIEITASHFSVMVKGQAHVFVAGPPLVKAATGIDIDKESLGGWREATRAGSVDAAVDTEDEALGLLRRVLGYFPSNVWQLPPRAASTDDPERTDPSLRTQVPRARRPIDVRRLFATVADEGSITEIAAAHAPAAVGALARLDGWPVVILGNDARIDGGGLSAAAADKVVRLIDLADTFHLPVVAFMDHPGMLVGLEAERAGALRAGCRALSAVYEAEVPWASVIVRRAYGAAGATHRNPARHTTRMAWPSAEWGSLPLRGGVDAAYRREIEAAEDPAAKRRELEREYQAVTSPFRTAEAFGIEDIIDPAETRPQLCRWVTWAYHTTRRTDMTSALRILGRTLEMDDDCLPQPDVAETAERDAPEQRPDDPPAGTAS